MTLECEQKVLLEVESPCIEVCESGPKGVCIGCGRTRDERIYFHRVPNEVKDRIVRASGLRLKKIAYYKLKKQAASKAAELGDDSENQLQLF